MLRLPYARFYQVARVAAGAEAEGQRQRLEEMAFLGWQMYLTNPFRGEQGPRTFGDWMKGLGLDSPAVSEPAQQTKEVVMAKVERLIERAKGMQWERIRVGAE